MGSYIPYIDTFKMLNTISHNTLKQIIGHIPGIESQDPSLDYYGRKYVVDP